MAEPTMFQTSAGQRPKIGIGVLVVRPAEDGYTEVLLGKRKKDFGFGKWALPGGHLELKESWDACAKRELLEETGLDFRWKEGRFVGATNDIEGEYHYVTLYIGYLAEMGDEPKNLEPHKCEGWDWFIIEGGLPQDLWAPLVELFGERGIEIASLVPPL